MSSNDHPDGGSHGNDGRSASDGGVTVDEPNAVGRRPGPGAGGRPRSNRIGLEARTDGATVRIEADESLTTDCFTADDAVLSTADVAFSRIQGRGERQGFRFGGPDVALEVIDGEVTATLSLAADDADDSTVPTRLGVHAQGTDVEYRFVATGPVEREASDGGDAEIPPGEPVTGRVAGSAVDTYLYTGTVAAFEASTDDVLVMLDDDVVDPATLGRR